MVSLRLITAHVVKRLRLNDRLDAFCDGDGPERAAQGNRSGDYRRILLIHSHARDERAVDLQRIQRHSTQRAQRRISDAEIVDRETNPEGTDLGDAPKERAFVGDDVLRYLDAQRAGIQHVILKGAAKLLHDFGMDQLGRRQVDRDFESLRASTLPQSGLPARLATNLPSSRRHRKSASTPTMYPSARRTCG